MTRVVHIRLDRYDVYIGRNHKGQVPPTVGAEGWLGNPYKVLDWKDPAHLRNVLKAYRAYLISRVETEPDFRAAVLALRGLVLGCFCVKRDGRGDCHGRVIAAFCDGRCLRCYGVFDDRGPDICACPKPIDARAQTMQVMPW